MMEFDIEKIKHLLPYVGSLVVFCGFIKLTIYYYYFNIDISDYLEITEVLTLVLAHIIKAFVLIFAIKLFDFLTETKQEAEDKQKINDEIHLIKSLRRRFWKYITTRTAFTFLLLFNFIFSIIAYFINRPVFLTILILLFYAFTLYISGFLLLEYKRRYKELNNKQFDNTYSNLVVLFVLFFTYTIQTTFNDIDRTENRNQTYICFNYLEKNIQTGTNILYVGQTKNYIFLYATITNETMIYPRSEINNIVISTKKIK